MRKWNVKKHMYEHYSVPKEWVVPLFCYELGKVINCACCGKEITYGDSYCSMVIHNHVGLGYSVCEDCHEKELSEEMEERKMKND